MANVFLWGGVLLAARVDQRGFQRVLLALVALSCVLLLAAAAGLTARHHAPPQSPSAEA